MEKIIVVGVLGLLLILIGIANTKGNISLLHSYHRKRVSEENRLPFGKLVGIGNIIIGASLIVNGVLYAVELYAKIKGFQLASFIVLIAGLVLGLGISFYAMIKYNKGIF